MGKKVLVLGGAFVHLGCIQEVKEMGHTALVADAAPDAPGLAEADIAINVDIVDSEAILEQARHYDIDAVVAVNDWGVLTAAHVAQEMGLPGLPVELAQIVTDKYRMRQVWEESGAPSIPYRLVGSEDELRSAAKELGFPIIIKPRDSRGGGSRGVLILDDVADLDGAFDEADSYYRDGRVLVEKCIIGSEHSVEAIVWEGKAHIIATSDNIKSPRPYRVNDAIRYPSAAQGEHLDIIHDAVQAAVSGIGMDTGIAHVELAVNDDGAHLFEMGARCGGGAPSPLVPYLSGVHEFKEAVRIALGETPKRLAPARNRGCAIKFVYPEPGRVTMVDFPDGVLDNPDVLSFKVFVRPGDIIRPLKTASDRAGIVITGGVDADAAHALAREVINAVHVETEAV